MPYSFAVKDIARVFGELTSKGVEFIHSPEKQFWGGTMAYFKDPDGNVMTLVEY
jgi:lactoylglutathione lyase